MSWTAEAEANAALAALGRARARAAAIARATGTSLVLADTSGRPVLVSPDAEGDRVGVADPTPAYRRRDP